MWSTRPSTAAWPRRLYGDGERQLLGGDDPSSAGSASLREPGLPRITRYGPDEAVTTGIAGHSRGGVAGPRYAASQGASGSRSTTASGSAPRAAAIDRDRRGILPRYCASGKRRRACCRREPWADTARNHRTLSRSRRRREVLTFFRRTSTGLSKPRRLELPARWRARSHGQNSTLTLIRPLGMGRGTRGASPIGDATGSCNRDGVPSCDPGSDSRVSRRSSPGSVSANGSRAKSRGRLRNVDTTPTRRVYRPSSSLGEQAQSHRRHRYSVGLGHDGIELHPSFRRVVEGDDVHAAVHSFVRFQKMRPSRPVSKHVVAVVVASTLLPRVRFAHVERERRTSPWRATRNAHPSSLRATLRLLLLRPGAGRHVPSRASVTSALVDRAAQSRAPSLGTIATMSGTWPETSWEV